MNIHVQYLVIATHIAAVYRHGETACDRVTKLKNSCAVTGKKCFPAGLSGSDAMIGLYLDIMGSLRRNQIQEPPS